jgi:hypothetical protein
VLVALALRGADAAEVRIPAPLWVFTRIRSRIGLRATSAGTRSVAVRLRARAPPAASVV